MPTGSGSGGSTRTPCADNLAMALAELQQLERQYQGLLDQWRALDDERAQLEGQNLQRAPSTASLGQVVQSLAESSEEVTERMPGGVSAIALLTRRAIELRERIDRLEARA